MDSSEDDDDLLFLSSVLNKKGTSSSVSTRPITSSLDTEYRKSDHQYQQFHHAGQEDARFFARVKEESEAQYSVDRLRKKVEHIETKKGELETMVKELRYVNGHLSKELEETKEKDRKREEQAATLMAAVRSGSAIVRSMRHPIQEFKAVLELSFSSLNLTPTSPNVPLTLGKLQGIYTELEKVLADSNATFEPHNNSDTRPSLPQNSQPSPPHHNLPSNTVPNLNSVKPTSRTTIPSSSTSQRTHHSNSRLSSTRNNKQPHSASTAKPSTPAPRTSSQHPPHHTPRVHEISGMELQNAQLKREIEEMNEREATLNASIPHYRMAILKLKANVVSLQDQISQISEQKKQIAEELNVLQEGIQESEREKCLALQKLTLVEEERTRLTENLATLQQRFTANKSLLDQLQETNQSLRDALESQMQYSNEREMEREKEEVSRLSVKEIKEMKDGSKWWEGDVHAQSPDILPRTPFLNTTSSTASSTSFQHLHFASHAESPIPPKSLPLQTSGLSLEISSSPQRSTPSPLPPLPTSFGSTQHLRREMDNLDAEIELLQTSLKRQLSEMTSR